MTDMLLLLLLLLAIPFGVMQLLHSTVSVLVAPLQ